MEPWESDQPSREEKDADEERDGPKRFWFAFGEWLRADADDEFVLA